MKHIFNITILLISIFLFSCKDEPIINDFDEMRNKIVGDWEVTEDPSALGSTFSISFNDDGTGVRESFLLDNQEFEWLYQYNPEKIVINNLQAGISLGSTQFYDVVTNKINKQVWTFESASFGVSEPIIITWTMDR